MTMIDTPNRKRTAPDRADQTLFGQLHAIQAQASGHAPFAARDASGRWCEIGWDDAMDLANACAFALLDRGLARGDTIAILAATHPNWLYADMGAMMAGVVSAGIYPTEPAAKVEYIVSDCAARILFVDTDAQIEKALALLGRCPRLEAVVVLGDVVIPDHPAFVAFDRFLAAGRAAAARRPQWLRDAAARVEPEDTAMLIYTFGHDRPAQGRDDPAPGLLLSDRDHADPATDAGRLAPPVLSAHVPRRRARLHICGDGRRDDQLFRLRHGDIAGSIA